MRKSFKGTEYKKLGEIDRLDYFLETHTEHNDGLKNEIFMIQHQMETAKLELNILNVNYHLGGKLGEVNSFIFGKLFGCIFTNVSKARLRKMELKAQRDFLKKELYKKRKVILNFGE